MTVPEVRMCNAYLASLEAYCRLPVHDLAVEHYAPCHEIEDTGRWNVYWQDESKEPSVR